jgi:3D (Asp-Asp-Asp) domain-containing protein/uncharacterized protein YabE (DUF348 family)
MIRVWSVMRSHEERSRTIRSDLPSPFAATGVLSLGLLIPFCTGSMPAHISKAVQDMANTVPAKHVTFVENGRTAALETRASTVGDLLAERSIALSPDDALSAGPGSTLTDGETVVYRAAVPVTVVVDGASRSLRSAAASVGELLDRQGVRWDRHDAIAPAPATALGTGGTVVVRHVERWTETVRRPIPPPVATRFALTLAPGKSKVLSPGRPGVEAISYAVRRTTDRRGVVRSRLAARILRAPHAKIVAEGIGEYTALSAIAERGIVGTLRLATSALSMVATAYSADCAGCSGRTATGRPAGHGVVAVDPSVIPLGTHLFIPGYGHAVAGDTGGSIRGRRIDLGFASNADADAFGRRSVTVYLFK